jgi:hypothetical protein
LSMRLAAVNPRVDFGGLDSFLTTEVLMQPSPFCQLSTSWACGDLQIYFFSSKAFS